MMNKENQAAPNFTFGSPDGNPAVSPGIPGPARSSRKVLKPARRAAGASELLDYAQHKRRCKVCKHPQCFFIELDFVDWRSPAAIAKRYGIRDRASIYRHAHATGLYSLRRHNLAMALDNIIERNEEVKVTSSAVVRAVRARTRITDDGDWVDPPVRSIVTHINATPDAPSDPYTPLNPVWTPFTPTPGMDLDPQWQQYRTATRNQTETEPNH